MSNSDTIKINKSSLWKVATFVLVIALVVVLIVTLGNGNGKTTGNAVQANQAQEVNLDVFVENPDLFPSLGPDNAENVVIEFSDFQCPYCALASGLPEFANQYATQYADLIGSAEKIQEMAANGELKFVYVPMSFLGQESVYAAQAGLCANEQGKFWEMHDAIFENHDGKENNGKYSKENLKILANSISGLDTTEFNDCLDNDKTLSDVQKAAATAGQIVSGTPTFYVNGVKMSASWNSISAALN